MSRDVTTSPLVVWVCVFASTESYAQAKMGASSRYSGLGTRLAKHFSITSMAGVSLVQASQGDSDDSIVGLALGVISAYSLANHLEPGIQLSGNLYWERSFLRGGPVVVLAI